MTPPTLVGTEMDCGTALIVAPIDTERLYRVASGPPGQLLEELVSWERSWSSAKAGILPVDRHRSLVSAVGLPA